MEALYGLKLLSSSGIQKMEEIGMFPFFFMMLCSLFISLLISHLYVRFYGLRGTGSTLHRAFPLLGVSITAIFVCLQFSIPLSLGLLGALSIVRFRTPIKDPEEVGFILLVIASSLTCATFNIPFLIIILVVAIISLLILKYDKFNFFRLNGDEGMLILKLNSTEYHELQTNIFAKTKDLLRNSVVESIVEQDDLCTMTFTFSERSKNKPEELRQTMKNLSQNIQVNIFYGHAQI